MTALASLANYNSCAMRMRNTFGTRASAGKKFKMLYIISLCSFLYTIHNYNNYICCYKAKYKCYHQK